MPDNRMPSAADFPTAYEPVQSVTTNHTGSVMPDDRIALLKDLRERCGDADATVVEKWEIDLLLRDADEGESRGR